MVSLYTRMLRQRHGGLVIFGGAFVLVALVTRIALLVKSASAVTWDLSLLAAFGWGMLYDIATVAWFMAPVALLLTFLPARFFLSKTGRALTGIVAFLLLALFVFGAVAEWIFWDEFSTRFNFIAVDYLIYTKEVTGNINESYPVPLIFAGIVATAGVLWCLVWRTGWPAIWMSTEPAMLRKRLRPALAWIAATVALGLVVDSDWLPTFDNNYHRELAKNGVWGLFAAFRANELDYDQFYVTLPIDQAMANLRRELTQDGSVMLRPTEPDTLRYVANTGPELHLNVIQITVESLSAEFLSDSERTPNLTALAEHSLTFDNFYATGTRTDRGMEALTLSIPPTPGRSLVKRPNNENLFTLGSVFRAKGYDTAFIYGGYGYFDNMNHYFGGNGYRVIDRSSPESDVTFANVWGACDEDLFRWTMREADAAAIGNNPFHFFVMTSSNHRPYTFPEGRIDIPSKSSGRAGAVKYTDFAIGQFLRDAESKPWFKNTVFVIVADHCASVAGKTELPVANYHIPLLIYAPGGQITPGTITTLASQIDYAPTLLGLLNWSYPSRFFGHDIRRINPRAAHALMGNYQKLGHLENDQFVILEPRRGKAAYRFDRASNTLSATTPTEEATEEAISYYQSASFLYRNGQYRSLSTAEFERYSTIGRAAAAAPRKMAVTPVVAQ